MSSASYLGAIKEKRTTCISIHDEPFFIQHFAPVIHHVPISRSAPQVWPPLFQPLRSNPIISLISSDLHQWCVLHTNNIRSIRLLMYSTSHSIQNRRDSIFPAGMGGGTGTYTKSYFLRMRVPLRLPLISCPSVTNLSSPSISQFCSPCASSPSLPKTQYSGPF